MDFSLKWIKVHWLVVFKYPIPSIFGDNLVFAFFFAITFTLQYTQYAEIISGNVCHKKLLNCKK